MEEEKEEEKKEVSKEKIVQNKLRIKKEEENGRDQERR